MREPLGTRFRRLSLILHSSPTERQLRGRSLFRNTSLSLSGPRQYKQTRQGGRVRPNAAACRAAHRRFKSGPWLFRIPQSRTTVCQRLRSLDCTTHLVAVCCRPIRRSSTLSGRSFVSRTAQFTHRHRNRRAVGFRGLSRSKVPVSGSALSCRDGGRDARRRDRGRRCPIRGVRRPRRDRRRLPRLSSRRQLSGGDCQST